MALPWDGSVCYTCNKDITLYSCQGCSRKYCSDHLVEHRTHIKEKFDRIQNNHNQLEQNIYEQITDPIEDLLIEKINLWEKKSIEKIKQTAQQSRDELINYSKQFLLRTQNKFNDLTMQLKKIRKANYINEIALKSLKEKLEQLQNELHQYTKTSIKVRPISFISNISLVISSLAKDTQWKQFGTTIAGGNGQGNRSNQFQNPFSICFDQQNQTIYIADCFNHRIIEWRSNATDGRIVAGGNGQGDGLNQLNHPTDVIIDRQDKSLIIADSRNRRVIRWFRGKNEYKEIIISDIECYGLAMHEDGSLYVSDCGTNEVKRWKKGAKREIVVAGGNGRGSYLTQFNYPTYLFVDNDHTLYVSDRNNHRVMKWISGANEGTVVAGGNDQGNLKSQLFRPQGVKVDEFGQIYVADCWNHRVMRWPKGAKEGTIVIGGNGKGEQPDQLTCPIGLFLDARRNLYVTDNGNNRIQKFQIE